MKHWTQREVRAGGTVSPDAVNNEMRAHQSSIITLDRSQLPADWVDENNLTDFAIHRVYADKIAGLTGGEITANVDTNTPSNGWRCITYQTGLSGYVLVKAVTLSGFKGGSLYGEWSGNALVLPAFCNTLNNTRPGSPKYLGFRILVNGTVFAVRRGVGTHEHFRIFGNGRSPQGDLSIELQLHITDADPNEPIKTNAGDNIPQVHLYSARYLFIGRWR